MPQQWTLTLRWSYLRTPFLGFPTGPWAQLPGCCRLTYRPGSGQPPQDTRSPDAPRPRLGRTAAPTVARAREPGGLVKLRTSSANFHTRTQLSIAASSSGEESPNSRIRRSNMYKRTTTTTMLMKTILATIGTK